MNNPNNLINGFFNNNGNKMPNKMMQMRQAQMSYKMKQMQLMKMAKYVQQMKYLQNMNDGNGNISTRDAELYIDNINIIHYICETTLRRPQLLSTATKRPCTIDN